MAGRAGQLPDRRGVGGRGVTIFQCLATRRAGMLKKAGSRLRDSASFNGVELTQPLARIFDNPCTGHRQGHPDLPRGVLARLPHGGRHRAAPQEDPVPLPLDGRGREDVQVERSDRFFGLILY